MAYQTCPACRLSVRTRFPSLPVQYCPRCLARRRNVVELGETTDRLTSIRVDTPRPRLVAQQVAPEHAGR